MLKTYFLFTLGCQMNVSDSERIEAVLEKRGLKPADEKSADLIIVNSCSVRQKPVDRIWGKVRVWSRINPKAKRILTGCILPSDLKKLGEKSLRQSDECCANGTGVVSPLPLRSTKPT
ncbi:MAG: bifunctional enzyme involved in thiolation and methylation of tRNA, partial [Candidatus Berkelbacteria bacterium Licking1014_96]